MWVLRVAWVGYGNQKLFNLILRALKGILVRGQVLVFVLLRAFVTSGLYFTFVLLKPFLGCSQFFSQSFGVN